MELSGGRRIDPEGCLVVPWLGVRAGAALAVVDERDGRVLARRGSVARFCTPTIGTVTDRHGRHPNTCSTVAGMAACSSLRCSIRFLRAQAGKSTTAGTRGPYWSKHRPCACPAAGGRPRRQHVVVKAAVLIPREDEHALIPVRRLAEDLVDLLYGGFPVVQAGSGDVGELIGTSRGQQPTASQEPPAAPRSPPHCVVPRPSPSPSKYWSIVP